MKLIDVLNEKIDFVKKINSSFLSKSMMPEDVKDRTNLELKNNGSITYLSFIKGLLNELDMDINIANDKVEITGTLKKLQEKMPEEQKEIPPVNNSLFNTKTPYILIEENKIILTLTGLIYLSQKYQRSYLPFLGKKNGFIIDPKLYTELAQDIKSEQGLNEDIIIKELKFEQYVYNNVSGIAIIIYLR